MIDLHSHILYNIDDGSKNIDESIEIIKKYSENNINKIVLTPHYVVNSNYSVNNNEKIKKFNYLKEQVRNSNIDIELYIGNEVLITNNLIQLLEEKEIMTINNSRYLLIELPFINEDLNVENIIYDLKLSGYIPIIAHPERYIYIQKDITKIKKYIEVGALIQINKDSFFGKYGKKVFKTVKKIIKNELAHTVGTDVHSINDKFYSNSEFVKKLKKIASDNYINKILEENSNNILNNKEIS